MRKRKKVSGPHFEISPELKARWDKWVRRLGRGGATLLLTSTMENILKQLEEQSGQQQAKVDQESGGVGETDKERANLPDASSGANEQGGGGEDRTSLPGGPVA